MTYVYVGDLGAPETKIALKSEEELVDNFGAKKGSRRFARSDTTT